MLFSEKVNSQIFQRHSKNSRQQDSNLAPTQRLLAPSPPKKKEIWLNGLQNGRWVWHTVAHTVLNNCSRWERLWGGGRQNVSQTAAKLEEDKCFITPWGGIHACIQTSKQNHLFSDFPLKIAVWGMGLGRKCLCLAASGKGTWAPERRMSSAELVLSSLSHPSPPALSRTYKSREDCDGFISSVDIQQLLTSLWWMGGIFVLLLTYQKLTQTRREECV